MKTLFENVDMRIYMNPSAEIFVHNKRTDVTLRMNCKSSYTTLTFDAARSNPSSINGLPAFLFTKD